MAGQLITRSRLVVPWLSLLAQDRGVAMAVAGAGGKLVSDDDVLILEDEKARMVLRGAEELISRVVTGGCLLSSTGHNSTASGSQDV